MWQAIIISITLIGALIYFVSCKTTNGTKQNSSDSVVLINNPDDSIKINKKLTQKEITEKLNELAKSKAPEPDKLDMGAMCYKMAAPPDRVDYVCPKCGSKTLYSDSYARLVDRDLSSARQYAEGLKKFNIVFDESEFCKKCQKEKIENPEMILIIHYSDYNDPKIVRTTSAEDILLINEFFNGKNKHMGAYGRESALKDHSKRLSELLDIEIK